MSGTVEYKEKEIRVIYVMPHEGDTNLCLDSNYKYVIKYINQSFMVDGHMHLQSLNCTPLQLQWATGRLRAGALGPTGDRRELTESTTGTGGFHPKTLVNMFVKAVFTKEFGDIGQFYTDSIGKLYLGRAEENSTRIALRWLFENQKKDEEELNDKQKKKEEERINQGLSDKQKKQNDLAEGREKSVNSFYDWPAISQYYAAKPLHMNIGHPMDLSYAHFWGIHRIPMYLNIPEVNEKGEKWTKFYFINDYRAINRVSGLFVSAANEGYHVEHEFDPLKEGFFEKLFSDEVPLTYNFPVEREYKSFKEFYERENKYPNHRLAFSTDRFQVIMADDSLDKASRAEALNMVFNDLKPYYSPETSEKKYDHYLEEVPLDTIEVFEEYSQQISYYAATGFRFPLQFLPFYHFDPRRHFSDTTKKLIVTQIMKEHRFSLLTESKGSPEVQGHGTMPSLTPAVALDEKYFNELFFEGVTIHDIRHPTISRPVQAPYKKHIDEAKYNVLPTEAGQEKGQANAKIKFPPHLFWGVKMYPPLGYAPDLYNQCKERYDLPEDYYDHLKDFFKYCEDAQIPITGHASPLGMSIGDGFNYILNDYQQREKKKLSPTGGDKWYSWAKDGDDKTLGEYDMAECALYMDQTSTHPAGWKRVIDAYPKIRYCFAHFGSSNTWEPTTFNDIHKYTDSPDSDEHSKLLNKQRSNGKHLGDTNLLDTFNGNAKEVKQLSDWRRMISECIEMPGKNNIYTDISYYLMYHFSREDIERMPVYNNPSEKDILLNKVEKREEVADQLIEAMKGNEALFHKIIMGSDWYMTETATTGQGEYYKGMFLLLQYMSKNYTHTDGENHDLWHQFTVVNPMRFLGLIPDDSTQVKQDTKGKDYYEINTEKILRYLGHLETIKIEESNYIDWWDYAHINHKIDFIDNETDKVIAYLKKQYQNPDLFKIYTSQVMMERKENSIKDLK